MILLNIVLLEPEIPQNTGNIARTCAATRSRLHLIEPMGFSVDEKHVRRAGLDYWPMVDLTVYPSLDEFYRQNAGVRPWMATTKAKQRHCDVRFSDGDYLMFGRETRGLPETLLAEHYKDAVRIPMIGEIRSLNLANSVAIAVYEAWRQTGYAQGNFCGRLRSVTPKE